MESRARKDFSEGVLAYTAGGSGVAIGYTVGGYLEYAITSRLSVRVGIDVSRRRYRYDVSESRQDTAFSTLTGENRIVYMAIEAPAAVLYHFDYGPDNDRFLVGVGGTLARWVGDPLMETTFYFGSSNRPPFTYSPYSLRLFGGYEHYIADRFVVGIEPFVSYAPTPTEFHLEHSTVAYAAWEAGISLRLRFDN
ncbi:hypothetical protein [Lewinella sp. IMCC34183]|uniref:hypothetical protein n=1 Tax=Lewinella sp. IMCC34183 TaxID=2248762 RepID=UPI0013009471|nr:hypothetical protein [Lewinella sp. IMCC34183]